MKGRHRAAEFERRRTWHRQIIAGQLAHVGKVCGTIAYGIDMGDGHPPILTTDAPLTVEQAKRLLDVWHAARRAERTGDERDQLNATYLQQMAILG
jgi:hypothetical protein